MGRDAAKEKEYQSFEMSLKGWADFMHSIPDLILAEDLALPGGATQVRAVLPIVLAHPRTVVLVPGLLRR